MVILFEERDLVSFGKYLLSETRTENVKNNNPEETKEEQLREVYDSDLANWMTYMKNNIQTEH